MRGASRLYVEPEHITRIDSRSIRDGHILPHEWNAVDTGIAGLEPGGDHAVAEMAMVLAWGITVRVTGEDWLPE
jgi:hypothetical protein